ncbi:hypothetical protein PEPMIC_01007 [Parvimonas micra ATCC 33270]|uniref:Uncharacterized protein n=1 Tax=Parvimonas micra ATCC 33270 TaxID=411465 RepID=A8SLI0_9FIRM|nr:hypothetical protein PEPMIC_01007 [Parvimonas micra ATCC 33270]
MYEKIGKRLAIVQNYLKTTMWKLSFLSIFWVFNTCFIEKMYCLCYHKLLVGDEFG